LGPHFTPVAGGASTFLQMYETIVDLSTGSNVDLCFVLLSKVNRFKLNYYLLIAATGLLLLSLLQFDIGSWLNYRRPRLSERSTFIDLISRALCNIGLNPEEEKLMLHEVNILFNHLFQSIYWREKDLIT